MAYVPRFSHLFKILLGIRDRAAAEGLFLEGSIEFEQGNLPDARLMFIYGTRLDPNLAGNYYNLAVVIEKMEGASVAALGAWRAYLEAAERDPRQGQAPRDRVRTHVRDLEAKLGMAS